MVHTRRKGKMLENKAKKELEDTGHAVIQAPMSTKYNKYVDFFGLIDLIALSKYTGTKRFIQVKANKLPVKLDIIALQDFKDEYLNEFDSVEWWTFWFRGVRKSKKGWERIVIG